MSNKNKDKNYEFESYCSVGDVSTYWFGMDVWKYYTPEMISDIVSSPMIHNYELRKLSNRLYSAHGLLTQAIDHMVALPSLYNIIIPKGKNQKKRSGNVDIMQSALNTIRHKELIRDALYKDMIDGAAFYYCEFTNPLPDNRKVFDDYEVKSIIEINELGINMSVIPLPPDYTKIVGRKNSSYVLAFNLEYFDTSAINSSANKLRMYPSEIRDGYHQWKASDNAGGNWLILDNTKTIVGKIRSKMEEPWGRPLCLAAIKDLLYGDYYKDTCRGVLDETNNRIIYQTLPPGQNNAVSSLTKNQQREQHDAVRQAVLSKNTRNSTSFFTVAAGTKIDQLVVDNSLLDEKNQSYINDEIGLDLGFMANLLSGTGSGNYAAQQNNLKLLLSEVYMWIEQISDELVKVINANLIKDKNNTVKLYYLPCSILTQTEFTQNMKELYLQGKGSLRAWIASTGVDVDAYMALMDSELELDFENKYPVHKTSYTLSNKGDGEAGRPSLSSPVNENTIASKSNGGNDNPDIK